MSAFLHKPQSVFLRRALFQVHLWTGILTGLYIVVVCVTGAALVFRIDLQRAQHPHLFTPSAPGPTAPAATILESIRDAYPGDRLSGIDAPTTTRPTYLAYVVRGPQFLTILADPVTGTVLGELPERSFVRTVQDLHFDLLGGRTGRVVNGFGALGLLLMCLTGAVIWWQGLLNWRRGLMIDVRRSWKRVNWDLHSAVGFWTLALIAIWAVTGAYFAFPTAFRNAVNRVSPISVARSPQSDPSGKGLQPPSWREMVEIASRRVPGAAVARVVLPSSDRGAFLVQFSDVTPTPAGSPNLTSVYLDQFTGAVLEAPTPGARTAGDVIMAWVAPLHVGNFGGFGIRLAWAILGLAPALLFVTGFIMWWTRVVKPRWLSQRENRATQPAATLGAALMLAMAAGHSPAAQHQWDLPPRVAAPRVPAEWPMTPARVELGRRLFYDTRLSGNGTQSCGTCHLQERAFTDGRALGLGSTGMLHARSPMSLVNTAYRDALTWANPALRTLETQVLVPLLGTTPVELGMAGHEQRVYAALAADPIYRRLFAEAFPGDANAVTTPNVAAALSAFEDEVFQFHNTALYNLPGPITYPADNTGQYEHTKVLEDVGKFRIPTLRNIAVTAPYMHDGSIATLDAVLDHYEAGGRTSNPNRTTALSPLTLTQEERRDLIAFLESLTDREALRDPRWSDPWK